MNTVGLLYGVKFNRGSISVIDKYNYITDNSYLYAYDNPTKELVSSINENRKLNVEINDKYTKMKKNEAYTQGSGKYLVRYERPPPSYNGKSNFAKSFNFGKYR
jgi:hypothetical protein